MAHEKRNKHYAVKSANVPIDIKGIDLKSRTVTGIGNTYNMVDSDGDILMPGCCAKSIKERGPQSKSTAKIKFARNHDLNQIPGKLTVLDEREIAGRECLYFEAVMGNSDLGRNTLDDYTDEIIDNHSIGFLYVWEKVKVIKVNTPEWDDMLTWIINPKDLAGRSEVYLIKEVKLYEISCVAFGANSATPFLGMAKNLTKDSIISKLHSKIQALNTSVERTAAEIISHKLDKESDVNIDDLKAELVHTFKAQTSQLSQFVEDLEEYIEIKDQRKEHTPTPEQKGIDYNRIASAL